MPWGDADGLGGDPADRCEVEHILDLLPETRRTGGEDDGVPKGEPRHGPLLLIAYGCCHGVTEIRPALEEDAARARCQTRCGAHRPSSISAVRAR